MNYDKKSEFDQLALDLQQACNEKIQAAEYGLAVLVEKQEIQNKYDDLEIKVEVLKQELNVEREQSELLKSKNCLLQSKNEEIQGTLFHECSSRESSLATKLADLKIEIKNLKKQERISKKELDHCKLQAETVYKENERLNDEKEQLNHENKELKKRESRFNEDYNLLEEEYTHLQKSLSKLKQTLVEFEGLKVENKSLLDEVDSLQLQLQITKDARDHLERQLHEALDTLKEQRNHQAQQQKDMYELKQQIITKKWQSDHVAEDFLNIEDEEHPIVRQIMADYKTSMQATPSSGLVKDLLKELQFTEIRDLEQQLRTARGKKKELEQHVDTQKQGSAKSSVAEASTLCRRNSSDSSEEGDEYSLNNQLKELSDLKETIKQCRNRETMYHIEFERMNDEIKEMREKISYVESEYNNSILFGKNASEEKDNLTQEVLSFKSKLRTANGEIANLRKDLHTINDAASESVASFNCVQDELKKINNDLLQILNKNHVDDVSLTSSNKNKSLERNQPQECMQLVSQIKQRVHTLSINSSKPQNINFLIDKDDIFSENTHLKEQLLKLQNFLSTKREQISTLRTVLKANKATYEVALANLKSRYENDKALQSEANIQLKQQIKSLKSECQTFTSLRSIYATRCKEYVQQLSAKEKSIVEAEEEKRTLNTLLKQAIHQKIGLMQRLEEFDLTRERLKQFAKKNIKSLPTKPISKYDKPITRV